MLVYLDGVRNRKGAPNENFAREVMELFSLGEGNYTEKDIKEAARAFTGWSLDRATGQYLFRPALHDYGVKTVLGKSGRSRDDGGPAPRGRDRGVVNRSSGASSSHPTSTDGSAPLAAPSALVVRLRVVLSEIMTSKRSTRRKSRYALSAMSSGSDVRVFDLRPIEPSFAYARRAWTKPSRATEVKGWPGGETWINTTTLCRETVRTIEARAATCRADRDGLVAGNADAARASASSGRWSEGFRRTFRRDRGCRFPGATPSSVPGGARMLLGGTAQAAIAAESLAVGRGLVIDASITEVALPTR